MKDFLTWLELNTVREFVEYGFRVCKKSLVQNLDGFIETENRFQKLIANFTDGKKVEQLLNTIFDFTNDDRQVYSTLFWAEDKSEFGHSDTREVAFEPSPETQCIEFEIPSAVKNISKLRIDPFDIRKTDKIGFFSISKVCLIEKNQSGEKICWEISGEQNIAEQCEARSAWFAPLLDVGFWLSSTSFPTLSFNLGKTISRSNGSNFLVRAELRVSESLEFVLAHQQYLVKMRQFKHQFELQLEYQEQQLFELKTWNNQLNHDLVSTKSEVDNIKAGKPFKLAMLIISFFGVFKR